MNPRNRRAVALLASLALLVAAGLASAAVHFIHESYQAFQGQLSAGQVTAVTFNKKAHTVHVTLKDGRHVLASYPPKDEPSLAAQIQAKGASVTVQKKKAKPVHHKLRYIAAGVLVVLIVIVALVLALNRRRPPAVREDAPGAGAAPAGPGSAPGAGVPPAGGREPGAGVPPSGGSEPAPGEPPSGAAGPPAR